MKPLDWPRTALPGFYAGLRYRSHMTDWQLLPSGKDFMGKKADQAALLALQEARDGVLKAFHGEENPFVKAAIWERYKGLCRIGSPIYVVGRYDPVFPPYGSY